MAVAARERSRSGSEQLEHGKRRRRAEGRVDVRSRSRDARLVAGAVRRMRSPRRCDAVDAAAEDVRGVMGDGEPRWQRLRVESLR